jgi:hypothetical protein
VLPALKGLVVNGRLAKRLAHILTFVGNAMSLRMYMIKKFGISRLSNRAIIMKDENPWIECAKELPPFDGIYNISNDNINQSLGISVRYDGYGFIFNDIYRDPKYWRYIDQSKKKYGKQDKEILPITPSKNISDFMQEQLEQDLEYINIVGGINHELMGPKDD